QTCALPISESLPATGSRAGEPPRLVGGTESTRPLALALRAPPIAEYVRARPYTLGLQSLFGAVRKPVAGRARRALTILPVYRRCEQGQVAYKPSRLRLRTLHCQYRRPRRKQCWDAPLPMVAHRSPVYPYPDPAFPPGDR